MKPIIEVSNVSQRYKGASENSLNSISFPIIKGSKLGIFGPNGAGKTTLISIICGILDPTEGSVSYFDNDRNVPLNSMLYKLGYVPQDFSFYAELTPVQNLKYFGALYSIPKSELNQKIDSLLSILGLTNVANKKVEEFSGGMKRRVNLAIGIINDPDILFLDEPTVGVDVQSKNAIISYLEKLNDEGTTIVYTSHHLHEAQELCDQIILMDQGNLIANDSIESLLDNHKEQNLETLFLRLTGTAYRD